MGRVVGEHAAEGTRHASARPRSRARPQVACASDGQASVGGSRGSARRRRRPRSCSRASLGAGRCGGVRWRRRDPRSRRRQYTKRANAECTTLKQASDDLAKAQSAGRDGRAGPPVPEPGRPTGSRDLVTASTRLTPPAAIEGDAEELGDCAGRLRRRSRHARAASRARSRRSRHARRQPADRDASLNRIADRADRSSSARLGTRRLPARGVNVRPCRRCSSSPALLLVSACGGGESSRRTREYTPRGRARLPRGQRALDEVELRRLNGPDGRGGARASSSRSGATRSTSSVDSKPPKDDEPKVDEWLAALEQVLDEGDYASRLAAAATVIGCGRSGRPRAGSRSRRARRTSWRPDLRDRPTRAASRTSSVAADRPPSSASLGATAGTRVARAPHRIHASRREPVLRSLFARALVHDRRR